MERLKEFRLSDVSDSIEPLRDFVIRHKWEIGATALISYAAWRYLTRKNLPPGPRGWPWIGLPSIFEGNIKAKMKKLHQEYGDVVYVPIMGKGMILLMTQKTIKEAFVQKGFTFNHRSLDDMTGFLLMGGNDEIFCDPVNEEWTANKTLAAGALRKFGSKQSGAEDKIIYEMSVFLDYLRSQKGQPVDIGNRIRKVTANVILSIIFDERYDHDEPRLTEFIQMVTTWLSSAIDLGMNSTIFPMWLVWILYREKTKAALELGSKFTKFMWEKFEQHRDSFDPNNIRDFIDVYLNERLGKGDYDWHKTIATIMLFLPDATDGIGNMVPIIMMYLAERPSCQREIQEQLDLALGSDKEVLLHHRPSIPKLDSFIMEAFRLNTLFSLTPAHINVEDATLHGYDIPKNTFLMGALENAMNNEEDFQDPDVFMPDRFLDGEGKLVKTDLWIPFGMGRRMCMGEQVVKMEIFLILSNILKNFTFKFEDENQSTAIEPGIMKRPPAYKLIFTPR